MSRSSFFSLLSPLSAIGLAALLSGCSFWSDASVPPQVAYACDDGSSLVVQFSPDAAIVKNQIGDSFSLKQQPAASGIRYAADGYALDGKGDDATWMTPGGGRKICRELPSSRGWW